MMNPPLRRPCLVILVGPPASGKSKWARLNGAGAILVSQDDVIDAITPHGFDHAYRPVYAAAENTIARVGLTNGFPVIVDRTNRTRAHRARWIRIASEAGCAVVAVVMSTSYELCRARNDDRRDHRRVSQERMERMLAAFESVGEEEGFSAIMREDEATLQGILETLPRTRWETINEHSYQTR